MLKGQVHDLYDLMTLITAAITKDPWHVDYFLFTFIVQQMIMGSIIALYDFIVFIALKIIANNQGLNVCCV